MKPAILEVSELKRNAFELNHRVIAVTRSDTFLANHDRKLDLVRISLSLVDFVADAQSRSTGTEASYCLVCARNSAVELTRSLYYALGCRLINNDDFNSLYEEIGEVQRLISGIIRSQFAA